MGDRRDIADLWSLRGRVAIVTGAGRGIGAAVAGRLAEAGASVVVNDLTAARAERVANALVRSGLSAIPIDGDISHLETVASVMEAALDHWERIDILINNAAIYPRVPLSDARRETFDLVMGVNVWGVLSSSWAIGRLMAQQATGGSIVNLLSGAAFTPRSSDLVIYGASKSAVHLITRALAKELAPMVRVNSVQPGTVDTDGSRLAGQSAPTENLLGRMGTADEVARAVLFVVSDMGEYVTGSNVVVDGGRSMVK